MLASLYAQWHRPLGVLPSCPHYSVLLLLFFRGGGSGKPVPQNAPRLKPLGSAPFPPALKCFTFAGFRGGGRGKPVPLNAPRHRYGCGIMGL